MLNTEGSDYLSYGLRIYSEATVWENLFLHAEFQTANNYISSEGKRDWVLCMPLGAGWAQPINDNMIFKAMILWDVLYKEGYSIQENPIFRVGVTYSL